MTVMPRYQLTAHERAKAELDAIPESEKTSIIAILEEAAQQRQPSDHPNVKLLRGENGLFRVRSGTFRAIATLDKPALKVLKVDRRETVYNAIDEAKGRLNDH